MSCFFPLNAAVTFSQSQTRGWHILNLCLSFKLGGVPALLEMGQICLLLIRLALSAQHASEVISLDKREPPSPPPRPLLPASRKEWMLCLSANLIQTLSTTKSPRQRKPPGKFTKRFSSHCWWEWSAAGQSRAEEDRGYVWFLSSQTLDQLMSLIFPPSSLVKDVFIGGISRWSGWGNCRIVGKHF